MRCPICGRPLIVKDGAKRKLRTRIVIFANGRAFAKCQYCKSDVEVPVFIDEVAMKNLIGKNELYLTKPTSVIPKD